MLEWLRKLTEDLGRLWSELSFATANGAVEAVRYEPRRMLLTGSRHLDSLPGGQGALVAGRVTDLRPERSRGEGGPQRPGVGGQARHLRRGGRRAAVGERQRAAG